MAKCYVTTNIYPCVDIVTGQVTVVEGGQFQIDVLTSWAELEDLEDLAKHKAS